MSENIKCWQSSGWNLNHELSFASAYVLKKRGRWQIYLTKIEQDKLMQDEY